MGSAALTVGLGLGLGLGRGSGLGRGPTCLHVGCGCVRERRVGEHKSERVCGGKAAEDRGSLARRRRLRGVRRVRVPRSARRRGGAAEVGVLRRRGRQSAADTLGGGDSCMRRRAAVSAVAVLNCEAQSRSGARSAETESFAVVIATSDERYQSEARPNTRSAVGARCSARPHGCSSSSAAGQPAAVCRMECRQARRRPRARRAPRVPRVAGRHESAPVTAEPHRLSEARSLQPIP
eukprot:scaffold52957_cov48-Phaeocystis_antarctica.AAC.4